MAIVFRCPYCGKTQPLTRELGAGAKALARHMKTCRPVDPALTVVRMVPAGSTPDTPPVEGDYLVFEVGAASADRPWQEPWYTPGEEPAVPRLTRDERRAIASRLDWPTILTIAAQGVLARIRKVYK